MKTHSRRRKIECQSNWLECDLGLIWKTNENNRIYWELKRFKNILNLRWSDYIRTRLYNWLLLVWPLRIWKLTIR